MPNQEEQHQAARQSHNNSAAATATSATDTADNNASTMMATATLMPTADAAENEKNDEHRLDQKKHICVALPRARLLATDRHNSMDDNIDDDDNDNKERWQQEEQTLRSRFLAHHHQDESSTVDQTAGNDHDNDVKTTEETENDDESVEYIYEDDEEEVEDEDSDISVISHGDGGDPNIHKKPRVEVEHVENEYVLITTKKEDSSSLSFGGGKTTTSAQNQGRQDVVDQESTAAAAVSSAPPASSSGMMVCPRCTLENLPTALYCVACEVPLLSAESAAKTAMLDMDHQLALQMAQEMNKGNDTELQSCLLDGTLRPRNANLGDGNEREEQRQLEALQYAFQTSQAIHTELETLAESLQTNKVCKVLATISQDKLHQYLHHFQERLQPVPFQEIEEPTKFKPDRFELGLVLTSQPIADICEQDVKESVRLFSALGNKKTQEGEEQEVQVLVLGEKASPYVVPSYQLSSGDYCWLVLLPISNNNPTKQKRRVWGTTDVMYRSVEEERFAEVKHHKTYIARAKHQVVIPLLCTANANLRRPPRPHFVGRIAVDEPDAELDSFAKIYHEAFQKFQSGVRQAM